MERWPRFLSQRRPPQPVAALPGLRRRPRGHDRGRQLRAHRPGRRRRPLPVPLPSRSGSDWGRRLRPAARRARDQRHCGTASATARGGSSTGSPTSAGRSPCSTGWAPARTPSLGSWSWPSMPPAPVAVLAAVAWRLAMGRTVGRARRRPGRGRGDGGGHRRHRDVRRLGPLRPGWSHRSGTVGRTSGPDRRQGRRGTPRRTGRPPCPDHDGPTAGTAGRAGLREPTRRPVLRPPSRGTQTIRSRRAGQTCASCLGLRPRRTSTSTPLTIDLEGAGVPGGGVSLSEGSVTFGPYRGTVTALDGSTIVATLAVPRSAGPHRDLNIDQSTVHSRARPSAPRRRPDDEPDRLPHRPALSQAATRTSLPAGPPGTTASWSASAPVGRAPSLDAPPGAVGADPRLAGTRFHRRTRSQRASRPRWRLVPGRPPSGGPCGRPEAVEHRWWWPTGPRANRPAARTGSSSTNYPHLVLDGAVRCRAYPRARRGSYVYVPSDGARVMTAAVKERSRRALDPCPVDVVVAPDRFLAGRSPPRSTPSTGGPGGIPSFVGLRPVRERGVGGRPTLVQNVEIARPTSRSSPDSARSLVPQRRHPGSPGTALLTVTGRWPDASHRRGAARRSTRRRSSTWTRAAQSVQGVLLGGYGGGWVTVPRSRSACR